MDIVPLSVVANGVPTTGLDMTGAFPFSPGMLMGLALGLLGVAIATAALDNWWTQRQAKRAVQELAALPKAA